MINNQKRKLIKKTDIVVIVVLLLICIGAWLLMNNSSKTKITAQISYNGKIVKEIDLATSKDTTFNLPENEAVNFEISDHKIRFTNTNCPDKLCENFGYLENVNDTAICLPNKVSLKLIGNKEEIDIVVN